MRGNVRIRKYAVEVLFNIPPTKYKAGETKENKEKPATLYLIRSFNGICKQ
jgi:hypothetical protein